MKLGKAYLGTIPKRLKMPKEQSPDNYIFFLQYLGTIFSEYSTIYQQHSILSYTTLLEYSEIEYQSKWDNCASILANILGIKIIKNKILFPDNLNSTYDTLYLFGNKQSLALFGLIMRHAQRHHILYQTYWSKQIRNTAHKQRIHNRENPNNQIEITHGHTLKAEKETKFFTTIADALTTLYEGKILHGTIDYSKRAEETLAKYTDSYYHIAYKSKTSPFNPGQMTIGQLHGKDYNQILNKW